MGNRGSLSRILKKPSPDFDLQRYMECHSSLRVTVSSEVSLKQFMIPEPLNPGENRLVKLRSSSCWNLLASWAYGDGIDRWPSLSRDTIVQRNVVNGEALVAYLSRAFSNG
jgi:hypothetical protein